MVAARAVGSARSLIGLYRARPIRGPHLDGVPTLCGGPGQLPLDPGRIGDRWLIVAVCQPVVYRTSTAAMPRSGAQATPATWTGPTASRAASRRVDA